LAHAVNATMSTSVTAINVNHLRSFISPAPAILQFRLLPPVELKPGRMRCQSVRYRMHLDVEQA
jgi:hypothetical protein